MIRKIFVDAQGRTVKYNRNFQKTTSSCHAYLALREDYRQQLRQIQKEIGFKYIRFHNVLSDEMGIYSETSEGLPVYNFQNLDKIYDFFIENGLKLFVELGFMPRALASGSETIFQYRANITPPKDISKWCGLIHAFVTHCIERYGLEEVITWRFEVWNEPDLKCFWTGSMEEYFSLYKYTALAIKAIDSRLKVGGPATAGHHWIQETLDFCSKEKVPLDFISTHCYSVRDIAIALTNTKTRKFNSPDEFLNEIKELTVDKVRNSSFKDIEIHYTEWNASPSHLDVFGKDSEFNPVFILQTIKDIGGLLDSYAYWTFSDIFEESGPGLMPFSGKYGLLNLHGIKKPGYHAFKFLAEMYDDEIETDQRSLFVTRDCDGNFKILTWNRPEVKRADFNGGEYDLAEEDIDEKIILSNVNGEFRVRCYRVNKKNGNAFRVWQVMGSPQYLTAEMVFKLHKMAEPVCIMDKIVKADGEIALHHIHDSCSLVAYDIEKA